MKSIFAGLSFVCVALAIPFFSSGDGGQLPFSLEEYTNYPGFDMDLQELRLIQLEGQDPVWMTELEKVCNTVVY
jgi:bacterial leucyl aminopeptidase